MRREGKKGGKMVVQPTALLVPTRLERKDGIAVKYYFQGLAVHGGSLGAGCLASFSDGARMIKQISCDWTRWSDVPHAGLSCRRGIVGGRQNDLKRRRISSLQ
jgi:hypothetical protein